MGKKFTPACANIFMAEWEKQGLMKATRKPTQFFRFLDDIWGIWDYSLTEFYDFTKVLKTIN